MIPPTPFMRMRSSRMRRMPSPAPIRRMRSPVRTMVPTVRRMASPVRLAPFINRLPAPVMPVMNLPAYASRRFSGFTGYNPYYNTS